MRLIPVDEICYFRAEDKYTRVVNADGDVLIREDTRGARPRVILAGHRGTIVNLKAIARVERDHREPLIVLKHRKEPLTVSRTFAHLFKAM